MNSVLQQFFDPAFWYSVVRVSTPLLFGTMAALICSIAGTVNIGIEGMMLMSAFTGTIVASFSKNPWVGLLSAVASAVVVAALLAYFHLNLKTDVVIAGVATNLLSSGLTVFLLFTITGEKGTSAALRSYVIPRIEIPILREIPFVGKVLSGHNVLTYLAIICVFLIHYLITKTAFGMNMRAVGENPQAALSVGISVKRMRYYAFLLSGLLSGFGGAFLSMGYVSWFARDMTAGRGFISLAAQALGGKSALLSAAGALLFGIAESVGITLQSLRIPSEITNMLPFILTLGVLLLYARVRVKTHSRIQEQ
ncbi:ABC transporter permease [Pseudothermotoga thermarum]|uniref:Nucleoside ABC transporter membrane protein n=1 Tax=Pseudothermotoga thermarum DSM 5069 TaxID=688269 RepID=F7YTR3_9THEM|nr:ABC transporter permease [Pseudothermotoga thermarum]AEH51292.1 nucleoside ABC transporter membrane protein [Pseudothermotoga thermarum DSM 5069]